VERERHRRQQEVDASGLSPSAGRVATRKTSKSSIEVEGASQAGTAVAARPRDRSSTWPAASDEKHQNPVFQAPAGAKLVSFLPTVV
jgi:hypothetical protein